MDAVAPRKVTDVQLLKEIFQDYLIIFIVSEKPALFSDGSVDTFPP